MVIGQDITPLPPQHAWLASSNVESMGAGLTIAFTRQLPAPLGEVRW